MDITNKDAVEDIILGYLAKERDSHAKDSDFISHRDVLKKLGLAPDQRN